MKKKFLFIALTFTLLSSIKSSLATTYTFRPKNASGFYSDTANWLNGQYPGTFIAGPDTLVIGIWGIYNNCEQDINVNIEGFCRIDSGVHFIIRKSIVLTVGKQNLPYTWGIWDSRFQSLSNTLIEVFGSMRIISARPSFGGDVTVAGSLYCYPAGDTYSNSLTISNIFRVKGYFSGENLSLNAKEMIISSGASIYCSAGQYYFPSTLNVSNLTNDGTINYKDCAINVSGSFLNNGGIGADYISMTGSSINNGSISVDPGFGQNWTLLISQSGNFINAGTVTAGDGLNLKSEFNGAVINAGIMSFFGGAGHIPEIVVINGTFLNTSTGKVYVSVW